MHAATVWALGAALALASAEEADPAMAALQEVQDIVGQWEGEGTPAENRSAVWPEELHFSWKFGAGGSAFLAAKFKDAGEGKPGRLFDAAEIRYDAAKKRYLLSAWLKDQPKPLEFAGQRQASGLRFDRVNKGAAKDALDRIEWKILNDGDRVVYATARKVGRTYKQTASVGLNRQGTTIAAAGGANGPKCIVTGGAGTMTVSHNGQTYYVCCTGCRDAFLADPEKFIARAKEKAEGKKPG